MDRLLLDRKDDFLTDRNMIHMFKPYEELDGNIPWSSAAEEEGVFSGVTKCS